jgi:hypothetical protein
MALPTVEPAVPAQDDDRGSQLQLLSGADAEPAGEAGEEAFGEARPDSLGFESYCVQPDPVDGTEHRFRSAFVD